MWKQFEYVSMYKQTILVHNISNELESVAPSTSYELSFP